jgi:glycosyltransferase involved in cell wall biosynthesis
MQQGLLSVIMLSYNQAEFLPQAIESALRQTYQPWELVVVDDGSADNSREIIRGYEERFPGQIRLFTHEANKNLGICASYRLALQMAKGEFIGFLEPDDLWEPANANEKIKALSSFRAGLAYSAVEVFGEEDIIRKKEAYLAAVANIPSYAPFKPFNRLSVRNIIPTFSAVVARQSSLQGLDTFLNNTYAVWLDWFLWLQLGLRESFIFLPEKLVQWRARRDSYCCSIMLSRNIFSRVKFESGYRAFVLKRMLASFKGNIFAKFKIIFFFLRGFFRVPILLRARRIKHAEA